MRMNEAGWLRGESDIWTARPLAGPVADAPEVNLCRSAQSDHQAQLAHQVFFVKSAPGQYRYKTPYKANPLPETQTQRALPERHGKGRDS